MSVLNYHVLRHFEYDKPLDGQVTESFLHESAEFDHYLQRNNLYSPFCSGPSTVLPLSLDSPLVENGLNYQKKYKPYRFTCWSRFKHLTSQPYRHQCDVYVPNSHISTTLGFSSSQTTFSAAVPAALSLPKLPVAFYVGGGGFQRGGKNEMWRSSPVMSEYFVTSNSSLQVAESVVSPPRGMSTNPQGTGTSIKNVDSLAPETPETPNGNHIDPLLPFNQNLLQDHVVVTMNYSLSSSSILQATFTTFFLTIFFSFVTLIIANIVMGITYAGLKSTTPSHIFVQSPQYFFQWVNIGIVVSIFALLFIIQCFFKLFTPRFAHPQHCDDVLQCIQWCDEYLPQIAPQADLSRCLVAGHSAGASIVSGIITGYQSELKQLKNIQFRQIITISGLYNYLTPSSSSLVNIGWWLMYTSGSIGYSPRYIQSCSSLYQLKNFFHHNHHAKSTTTTTTTTMTVTPVSNTNTLTTSTPLLSTTLMTTKTTLLNNDNNDNSNDNTVQQHILTPLHIPPTNPPLHWLIINASDDLGLEHGGKEFYDALVHCYAPLHQNITPPTSPASPASPTPTSPPPTSPPSASPASPPSPSPASLLSTETIASESSKEIQQQEQFLSHNYPQPITYLSPLEYSSNKTMQKLSQKNHTNKDIKTQQLSNTPSDPALLREQNPLNSQNSHNSHQEQHKIVETQQIWDNNTGSFYFFFAGIPHTTHASVVNRIYNPNHSLRNRIQQFILQSDQLWLRFEEREQEHQQQKQF